MIKIIKVFDKKEANTKAHELLTQFVDNQTLLALSGGTTPDYGKMIVEPADIWPGSFCVVDERYGEPFHDASNELLLKNSGLLEFAKKKGIPAQTYLWGAGLIETQKIYDEKIVEIFKQFPKKIGVMGIGANTHTAGIFPYSLAGRAPDYVVAEEVEDKYPLRLTLTMKALGEFSSFVILALGDDKKEALKIVMDENENDIQKYPAIFFRKASIDSFLITDQQL